MNAMTYKGYYARVEFDPDDQIFVGRLAGLNDIVGFHADNVSDLVSAFHEAVDDYLETCKTAGKPAEKYCSGNVLLRMSPDLHAKASVAAQLAGKSLNQWGEEVIAAAAEQTLKTEAAIPPKNSSRAPQKASASRRKAS